MDFPTDGQGEQEVESAQVAPAGWREVLARARLGLGAGSRSKSSTDFEVEYGGAMLDHIEEGLAALAAEPVKPQPSPTTLAPDHKGMRVDYRGMLRQAQNGCLRREPALAEMLRQLTEHMTELGERFYAGEAAAVDEFLQLYCVAHEHRAAALAVKPQEKQGDPAPSDPCSTVALINECRAALAEELAGWDLDPPLHHVKQAHDRCVEWLAATQADPVPWMVPADVMAALDRMCSPLHESRLSGVTATEDARCMSLIRNYVLAAATKAVKPSPAQGERG